MAFLWLKNNITRTTVKNSAIKVKNEISGKKSINNPPKIGPEILPKLKAIPHKIFPAGSKLFGNKSAI